MNKRQLFRLQKKYEIFWREFYRFNLDVEKQLTPFAVNKQLKRLLLRYQSSLAGSSTYTSDMLWFERATHPEDVTLISPHIVDGFADWYNKNTKMFRLVESEFFSIKRSKIKLTQLTRIMRDLSNRRNHINALFNRITEKIRHIQYLVRGGSHRGKLKRLIPHLGRLKKVTKSNYGGKEIHLTVLSRVDVLKDKIGKGTIYNFVKKKMLKELQEEDIKDYRKDAISKVLNGKSAIVEEKIVTIIKTTVRSICRDHPRLFRVPKVNLQVIISPPTEKFSSYSEDSSFDRIFIRFVITEDFLKDVIKDNYFLSGNSSTYTTLLHELTHAYDWFLKEDYLLAKEIVGGEPTLNLVALTDIIAKLREEGIANINSFLGKFSNTSPQMIHIFAPILAINKTRSEIEAMIKRSFSQKPKDIQRAINSKYLEGPFHTFGSFMTIIILLHRAGKLIYLYDDHDKEIEPDILNKLLGKSRSGFRLGIMSHGWERIPPRKIQRMVDKSKIILFVPQDSFDKIRRIIKVIMAMPPIYFLESYLAACKKMNLDPHPFTRIYFREYNKRKRKQIREFHKKEGFQV